jgi:type II secretory pathway component PulM
MKAARDWWDMRPERERRAIAWGVGAVLLALALVLWLDAERSRARLAAELPRLRASIAALERDADEVQRIRSMAPVQAVAQSPLVTLATNSGGLPGASITLLDERRVKVTGEIAFGALLEWLRNSQATHGMKVDAARIEALAAPGRVRADLTLSRS